MRIRKDQLTQLRKAAEQHVLEQFTTAVIQQIGKADSALIASYSADALRKAVHEALRAALGYDIRELSDLCQWTYLNLSTRHQFWDDPGFRYFLDEPLFHPNAKVRNLVTAYKLAVAAAQRGK